MKRDLPSIDSPPRPMPGLPVGASAEVALVDLMERIAAGQRDAFRALYVATSPRLLATARRLVRDATAAEDVVQETYLRVWRYSRSYDATQSAPMTWITQILRNRAIDLRAFGRHEEVPLDEDDMGDSDVAPLLSTRTDDAPDARVTACFDRLQGPHRQVLTLAYRRGLSHAEIAEHLGVPLGTAKTWVRRALIALRVSMAEQGGTVPAAFDSEEE